METYLVPMWVVECGVQRDGCISMVKAADAQATVEALQAVIRQMGEQAAVLAKDGMAAKAQVDALQRVRDEFERERDQLHAALMEAKAALDAEREKVKGLHEITKVICAHCCEPMEIPSKAVLQTQLGRTLPATTPAGQRWRRERPTAPGWYWWRHNACSPVHATHLERGNGCDHDGLWYAKENMCVPHNAAYVPYGEWQGPISPNEATE